MSISLKHIIPAPLADSFDKDSDIWGKNLRIDEKEFVHVSAPSGSGKTTLVSILYGLRKDYSGEFLLNNKLSTQFTADDWSKLRAAQVSIVFQDLELLEEVTALDNILLKNQLSNHFELNQILEYAKTLGIDHRLDAKASELSRGEKQRVCILRALSMPFSWLILDEPFSHLDEENTQKAIQLIQTVAKQNDAGLLLVNLFDDNYFEYSSKLNLIGWK